MADPVPARRKVWITRTEPGAARTAERVAALGLDAIIAPLLTVRPTGAALDLQPFEALALTSGHALAGLGSDIARTVRVFTVGEATARAARAAGFNDVISADGDVKALAATILEARPIAVAHPAAARTSGDLARVLTEAGVPTRRVVVYRADAAKALPETVAAALAAGELAAILLHSPRAAQVVVALTRRAEFDPSDVLALGLSPACVRPLRGPGFIIHAAAEPTEAALMALLARTAATI